MLFVSVSLDCVLCCYTEVLFEMTLERVCACVCMCVCVCVCVCVYILSSHVGPSLGNSCVFKMSVDSL